MKIPMASSHAPSFLRTSYLLLRTFLPSLLALSCYGQPQKTFTRQDSLRGTNTPERAWWDVKQYNLNIRVDVTDRSVRGYNQVTFATRKPGTGKIMQIDLQPPMELEKVEDGTDDRRPLPFRRDGNVYYIDFGNKKFDTGTRQSVDLYFKGKPRAAVQAPWDGGWVWATDKKGRPWLTVACQGLGASVWYPCKDYQADEPDEGALVAVRVPDTLVAVANGRLLDKTPAGPGEVLFAWQVKSPINNYNLVPYIGKYVNWTETYAGEKGPLACSYWVLDYNLEKAKEQFAQVPRMLKALEYWFGPYPFYEDGYKLVESPHLGMEHQSAIAYGNGYRNGYLGVDLSGTGWGLKWDYIIVHESGHEWFGNNITTKDIADMWVHEGFTDYSETLFTGYYFGQKAADAYVQGLRHKIANDRPVIGHYGVNEEGSPDMYFKGANLVHLLRQLVADDEKFRQLLRGLNKTFYHQTVTTGQVEAYLSKESGKDFSKVFDQYLRTAQVPVLELKAAEGFLDFRWTNCIDGFNMPVKLTNGQWLQPTPSWQKTEWKNAGIKSVTADPNFYIKVKKG
ncbi:M1 family metallopeptidase [Paraflavisolibacter sp. H34]|uniref:M1 family metallopeptidase n=1 Tax=Huijunlia imazamoxiresistens TaxID=3127457 RepID=UPI003016B331